MDSEDKSWIYFVALLVLGFTVLVSGIVIYNIKHDKLYYSAWNGCVNNGGQPTEQTMLGSEVRTFTCIRK